jgi:hypothetical protein
MDALQKYVEEGFARWYRGRLIPIIRGGDGRDEDEPLFPALPEDLSALNDEELAGHLEASLAAKDKIVAQDPELLGDLTAPQILAAMQAGVEGILALKAEQASRVEAAATFQAEVDALAAKVTPEATLSAEDGDGEGTEGDGGEGDAGDGEGEGTGEEGAGDGEGTEAAAELEPVTAAAQPRVLRRLPAAGRHVPIQAGDQYGMQLVASAGLSGFRAGEAINSEGRLAEAILAAANSSVATPKGFSDKVVVARADLKDNPRFPEANRIRSGDDESKKITELVAAAAMYGITDNPEALTASGGICAPVTPYYQLANVSTVQRPVRDSLVGFIADRGGIHFAPPPVLSDVTTAVGIVTAANDKAGGTLGTKSCQTVICPPFTEVDVDSIFHCVTAGNLGARAFPEQIAQFNALVLAAHARVAETNLLDKIKAGSTAVTGQTAGSTAHLGAVSTLLSDILAAGASIRSVNRMMDDSRLQVILPMWTGDVLVNDLINSQFQRFQFNQAGVEALLDSFNIQVTYTLDGPSTGASQVFGRQTAGAQLPFPTHVQWAIFPAGSWLFVDSGVLELGIVRDSVLNATNSYQIFGESWENAAGIGVQSLWVTSAVCPNGAVALPLTSASYCG